MTMGRRITASLARMPWRDSRVHRVSMAAAIALVLAACGQSPSIVLTLDSAGADLLRGSDVQIVVTLTRAGGASADVALSVTGLPANVDALFSPATLTGGTLASTLTLSAASAAVAGSYDLTVTGTGTGLVDGVELVLDVMSLTVTGRVVSVFDVPVPGVSIRSQGDSAVADANGSFSLTGLSVPYDVAVWNTAQAWVQIYEDLTADELLLSPIAAISQAGTPRSASVSGNLTGGVIPVAANQVVIVCAEGEDGIALGCDTVSPTESAYSVAVQWFGSTTRTVRIHALQYEQDPGGYPVGYQGYGVGTTTTLTDTEPATANLDLGAALTTTTVDVEVDSLVAISTTAGAVQVGPNLALPVMKINSGATSHEAVMPVIGAASYSFVATTGPAYGWQADVTGGTVDLVVPAAPQLVAPANLATGVTNSTDFTVSNPAGGPVTFLWNASFSSLIVGVTSMDLTKTIPDLTEYGLTLPAGTNFSWQVIARSGTSTEDGAFILNDLLNLISFISLVSPGPSGDGTLAPSGSQGFTTPP